MAVVSFPALAHVKWFASWDIICPPRDPMRVVHASTWQWMFVGCIVVMAALAALDWRLTTSVGRFQSFRDSLHEATIGKAMVILRIGMAAYWILAAFTLPDTVYLTPELTAPTWVCAMQAISALLVLNQRTAWLAGLGLISMFAMATLDHCWFHLLDYPLFLGIGIVLVMTHRANDKRKLLAAMELLRWSAALTLLWGGIEKFAYPEWSFGMLGDVPFLSLGVSPETAMMMYGFAEIALSFGLLLFGVGSQVAALILLVIFVGAVPPFGWRDLVGHSGICVALLLLTLVKHGHGVVLRTPTRSAALHAALFASSVAVLLTGYFGLHAVYLPTLTQSQLARQKHIVPRTLATAVATSPQASAPAAAPMTATIAVPAAAPASISVAVVSPARSDSLAQTRAPLEPPVPAPTRVATTAIKADLAVGATDESVAPTNPRRVSNVEDAVRAWALAWSERDLATYAAAYTADFKGSARSHRAWLETRQARITPRKFIHVDVSDLEIVITGEHARARFLQRYASNFQRDREEKVLELVRSGDGRWRIEHESKAGCAKRTARLPSTRVFRST